MELHFARVPGTRLGVDFEVESWEHQRLSEDEATLKTMKEAAKQLGLSFETEE